VPFNIERKIEMKLCERCKTYDAMLAPKRDESSRGVVMSGSPSGSLTFFYPTEPGTLCYYCEAKRRGRITRSNEEIKGEC